MNIKTCLGDGMVCLDPMLYSSAINISQCVLAAPHNCIATILISNILV